MKNLAYIISNINKAVAFEWISMHLDASTFNVMFILLNQADSEMQRFCDKNGIKCHTVKYRSKKDIPGAILKTRNLLKKHRVDLVHCHLVDAGMVGIAAARLAGIKKRIYTRHHSTFHEKYFPRARKYDKWINRNATHIVAISKVVYEVLTKNEGVPTSKVLLVHHGFDLDAFMRVPAAQVAALKEKYSITSGPVIGVVSRYFELKGIHYIIPAFELLLQKYPTAHLVLANVSGNYAAAIKAQLQRLPPGTHTEIGFENNNFALYRMFDVFVHVPIDDKIEAFGQTYVEALASGVPSVFTLSGVAREFIEDSKNALVVPYCDHAAIAGAVDRILSDPELKDGLVKNGYISVENTFGLSHMLEKLETLYA